MKLYHATTVYHLLNAIAHAQECNTIGEDHILLAPWLKEKFSDIEILKAFFKDYYFYNADISRIPEDKLVAEIDKSIDELCRKNALNLDSYDEIVVGGAQYNFGIYLCNNNIKFSLIEESCGILSRPEIVENIDSNFTTARAAIAKKLEIFRATHDAISRVYCDIDSQAEGFVFDKMVDFKVLEIIKTMDESKIEMLLNLFGIFNKIDIDKNAAFLLTQQFACLKLMDFNDQILIYQLFCDFFLKCKTVVIKPHPDDPCYYSQLISNATVVREKFPSELAPFVFKNLPDTVATISSTGINPLKPVFKNIIQLDFRYEREFRKTIKYYVALKIVESLKINKCQLYGANENLLCELAKVNDIDIEFETLNELSEVEGSDDTIVVVDNCSHDEEDLNTFLYSTANNCIFLNTDGTYGFYRYESNNINKNFIPVVVKKTVTRSDENHISIDDEVLYTYSKNKEIYNKMRHIELEENLENTGISFKIADLTDEQLEIERLKGILAATEKRLLYYIERERTEAK